MVYNQVVPLATTEAMAIKEALSWIDSLRWTKVILESNCLVVVQAIRSKTPRRSYFDMIIEEGYVS